VKTIYAFYIQFWEYIYWSFYAGRYYKTVDNVLKDTSI
jgi:hypothetical protein